MKKNLNEKRKNTRIMDRTGRLHSGGHAREVKDDGVKTGKKDSFIYFFCNQKNKEKEC
ncbi:MAG: hypothetical protein ACOX0J_09310 [Thermoactinomyces vulgaris]|jgi:hypothetical protein